MVDVEHLRLDAVLSLSRAVAEHLSECPEIGPICQVRDEPPQWHESTLWITELRFLAEYGLFKDIALQAMLPLRLVDTRTVFSNLEGEVVKLDYENIHHPDETLVGIGDPQFLLHGGWRQWSANFGGRIGVSIPLGATVPDPYRLATRGLRHQHLQFGTGTIDPVLGLDVAKNFGAWSLAGFGNVQWPLYAGARGYQAGKRFFGGVVAASSFGQQGYDFRISAAVYHETAERWHGVVPTEDGNQGRTDLYAGPGLTVPLGGDWNASIDLRTRVYGHAVNAQLDLPLLVSVSVGSLFHLEDDAEARHAQMKHDDAEALRGDVQDVVLNGEAKALVSVPGKWTIFDFWAPWCEACRVLDVELRKLSARDPNVVIRRVNIVDFDSPIARQELKDVSVLPRVRVVTPAGQSVWEASGTVDELLEGIQAQRQADF